MHLHIYYGIHYINAIGNIINYPLQKVLKCWALDYVLTSLEAIFANIYLFIHLCKYSFVFKIEVFDFMAGGKYFLDKKDEKKHIV